MGVGDDFAEWHDTEETLSSSREQAAAAEITGKPEGDLHGRAAILDSFGFANRDDGAPKIFSFT